MNGLFTSGSWPDSDPGNLIKFQVSTPTPVTVGPTADWPLNCIFSINSEAMCTKFGCYDNLMIVYQVNVFYDQGPFCLVAMETLNLKKKTSFLNDSSYKATEAVWL